MSIYTSTTAAAALLAAGTSCMSTTKMTSTNPAPPRTVRQRRLDATDAPTRRTDILRLNSEETSGFRLRKSGWLESAGHAVACRIEGHGTGPGRVTLVNGGASGTGRALHYFCGAQKPGDVKARQEHYLHVAPMDRTFFSEFSLKLDPDFTPVEPTRPDGGPNWCILRQWHQSAPESPPISLQVVEGTNNVLRWRILFGDSKGHRIRTRERGKRTIGLGRWVHFRVQWHISPDENGRCVVLMSDRKLPGDLTDDDTLFRYKGPIGYTLASRPAPAGDVHLGHGRWTIREQQGVYQGPHLSPGTHHGYCIDNVAIYQLTPETQIRVDPYCRRRIRGISELSRQAYFGLCDKGGTNFDVRCRSKERYDWLIKENGITFGRALGVVNGLDRWYRAIKEDPARPGFADAACLEKKLAPHRKDPSNEFRRDMGGRLDVAAHGNHNAFPEFMGAHLSEAAAREKKPERLPENIEAAAHLSAATLRSKYTDFDRPAYYELVNEPHWSYWRGEHLAKWHTRTKEVVHEQVPGVLVGGPCLSVAYYYKKQYRAFDGLTTFIDNTGCDLDFYSFHVYDFLRDEGGDFRGRITSGLPLESVLDLVQNYTVNTYGKEIAVVVSEHGGYGANDLVEKLAKERFTETGFEWEMKKRSIDDFNMVSSVLANTLAFMDHPHTVWKAVPFILLNGLGWNPAYYASLYVPRDYDPKSEEWLATKKIMFYRLLRDLKGHRVAGSCPDPDIQMRAFADGKTLFVVLNNLSNNDKSVTLELPRPAAMLIRRFGRNPDYTPYLTEEPLPTLDGLTLNGREAVVIKATYPEALDPRQSVDEVPCYGDGLAEPVEGAPAQFTVRVPDTDRLQYATLRIGISRPPDAGWDVAVAFNGRPLNVPMEACAERLAQPENEYASCKIIPLDPTHVKAKNTVTVSFPDGKPGAVGAVVIRAGLPSESTRSN